MKVRLIDELTLQIELFCQIQQNAIESGSIHYDSYKNWCLSGLEVEKAINDIFSKSGPFASTIDPETLPVVQELRKQLADVEPVKHGKWEHTHTSESYFNECWRCSVCGFDDTEGFGSNYCPKCGAHMDL